MCTNENDLTKIRTYNKKAHMFMEMYNLEYWTLEFIQIKTIQTIETICFNSVDLQKYVQYSWHKVYQGHSYSWLMGVNQHTTI